MEFLKRPLLLEGEAGVGKTEVAKALAAVHGAELIRLQCYEGLDQNAALYEWNYQRQLLAIKAREGRARTPTRSRSTSSRRATCSSGRCSPRSAAPSPPVLLIDEVDRADEEFEAFLLELLSDFQVSIPELGTITAISIPRVVLTSNGTRELSDALRRRCLYHYVDFPDVDREARIIADAAARHRRRAGAAGRAHGGGDPQGGSAQGAGRRRDARLGGDACRASRCTTCAQEPEAVHETHDLPAQDPRGPRRG